MHSVSVVIPAHRLDDWLAEAVESTLASEGVEVEVVVVLDGFAEAHPGWADDERVRLHLRPTAGGPAAAMNDGIALATGRFIARLDSDDRCRPDRLARQCSYLAAHPEASAVGSLVRLVDGSGASTGSLALPLGDDVRSSLLLYNVVPHSTLCFRADAIAEIGRYDDALAVMEDYEFILRLATLGQIAMLDAPLVDYREHSTQLSRSMAPRGAHVDVVLTRRRELAAVLGVGRPVTAARNLAWRAVRYWRAALPTGRLAGRTGSVAE